MSTPIGVFYGRMNPFTRGHASVLNVINKNGRDPVIIVSHTKNGNKNPLTANQKIAFIKQSLPGRRVRVMSTSKNKPTIFHLLHNLKGKNPNIKVYLGSNRIKTLGGFIEEAGYSVGQFGGNRNANLEGVSGTRSRTAARAGNRVAFQNMMVPGLSPTSLNAMMKTIRNQTFAKESKKKKRENTPSENKPQKKKKRENTPSESETPAVRRSARTRTAD